MLSKVQRIGVVKNCEVIIKYDVSFFYRISVGNLGKYMIYGNSFWMDGYLRATKNGELGWVYIFTVTKTSISKKYVEATVI